MLLALLPTLWLPLTVSRASQVLLWMFYVLAYVPSVLIPYYVLGTGFDGVFLLTVAIVVSFVIASVMQNVQPGSIRSPLRTIHSFELIVLGLALTLGAYIIYAFGLQVELPNVADVYDVRASTTWPWPPQRRR